VPSSATGRIEDRLGKLETIAGRLAAKPSRLRPDHGDLFRHLGAIYLARGEPDKAVHKLETAMRCNPKDCEGLELLVRGLRDVGRSGDAAIAERVLDKFRGSDASTSSGTDRRLVRRRRRPSRPDPDRGQHRRRRLALDDVPSDEPVVGAVVARRGGTSGTPTRQPTARLVVEAVAESQVVDPADPVRAFEPVGGAPVDELVAVETLRDPRTASVTARSPVQTKNTEPAIPLQQKEDMGGRFQKALVLKNAKLYDEAIAMLRDVVSSPSYAPAAYTMIGHCLAAKGDHAAAISSFVAGVVQTRDPEASPGLEALLGTAFDLAEGKQA